MFCESRYKTQDYFQYFLHLFSVPSLIFSKKLKGALFCLPSKDSQLFTVFIQKMVSRMVILFGTKCFSFVYMYIDLFKLKAYKLFENSDADLSWLFFSRSQLVFRQKLTFTRYKWKYGIMVKY